MGWSLGYDSEWNREDLHRRFGTWFLAACAYNWGPGNLAGIKRLDDVPAETRAYAMRIVEAR